ncbi:MAG TPA: GntR family transcriptional regulator [Metabacillus sp.]|nr:GntR family transcriptional regulator [Metabacillus sp.]
MTNFINNALSETIAEHITHQIVRGELKPGDKLVEKEYAEEYGTSRSPVREAIYLLTIEGLVERIPRKGAVVKEYTHSEINDLLEVRNMLEKMAMQRIKIHGTDQKVLQEMKKLLMEMKFVEDVTTYTQLNHSFHMCLIKMSKSKTIMNVYSRLGWPLLRIQSLSFARKGNIEKSIAEHDKIVKLLAEQDMKGLSILLSKHNEDVIKSIEEWFNDNMK